MLFHISIAAHNPQRVAHFIAALWGGQVIPFPPISGAWMAIAGDSNGSAIEVYPFGTVLREADGDADAYGADEGKEAFTPTHAAVATVLSETEVLAKAESEGWPAKYRKRGGLFGVIELWIEQHQMIEILTPEMQDEYRQVYASFVRQ